jgi:hypothetical protein
MNPKVETNKTELSQNTFECDGKAYDIPTLVSFCKEKGYKPFDLPLAGINLNVDPFKNDTFYSFIDHCKRIENCDLKYPIIINDRGYIADGWHRVAKAILSGKTTIKAIRMNEMPTPSRYITEEKK